MQKQKEILKNSYGFEFPDSFFEFYEFTKKLPEDTFSGIEGPLGLYLGRIFRIFEDDFSLSDFNPIKQNRHYNDPPEFFTILHGDTDGLHWGYYLDNQNNTQNLPVASYYSNDAFEIGINGNSIFEAFRQIIEYSQYHNELYDTSPEVLQFYEEHNQYLETIRQIVMQYETGNRKEIGDEYINKYSVDREKTALTRDYMLCLSICINL
jgi:Uncharacterised conserved protein (DUF2228)